jgi:exodeoxyribonuclease V beta subunit
VQLGELLIVTFTRAATAELRERIRRRLVGARDHLAQELARPAHARATGVGASGSPPASGTPTASATPTASGTDDEVLRILATGDRAELLRRHQRLATALDSIDTAAITTIHGYCQQVLSGLGLAADLPGEATLVDDEAPLIDAAARDLLVERFIDGPDAPSLRDAVAVITAACADPDARTVPADAPVPEDATEADLAGAMLADLARRGRRRVARRKEALGVVGHQDLLTRLRDTVQDATMGPAARATIRERTRIALVDEFQDTDPVQWAILSGIFGGPVDPDDPRALVLIGDPKQAIYGFRGADVRAYLAATRASTARWTLETNWRSDGDLLTSLDRLLDGVVYGETGIEHAPVRAAPGRDGSRLTGDPTLTVPLTLRVVTEEGPQHRPPAASARHGLIADDVVAEVARLLQPDALRLADTASDEAATDEAGSDAAGTDAAVSDDPRRGGRAVSPGDIAILVRANRDAHVLQRALIDHGIQAVLNSVGSVFGTPAAVAWRDLLDAVRRPNDTSAARRVGVGPFSPMGAAALLDADDAVIDGLHQHLAGWSLTLRDHGVAALERRVATDGRLAARLLATAGGERLLTDLQHVGALLHEAQGADDLGPAGLVGWLDERIAAAEEERIPPDEQARRLESDAQAVQILTIHRSKGLEFGIVLCPYLWVGSKNVTAPYEVAEPNGTGRLIDVGPKDRPGAEPHRQLATDQQHGEGLRLIYVALTRARHKVVLWWSPPHNRQLRPLDTILFGRDDEGRVLPSAPGQQVDVPVAKDAAEHAVARLAPLLERCHGRIDEVPAVVAIPPVTVEDTVPPELTRAVHRGVIDHDWRRTSYSRLLASAAPAPTASPVVTEREDQSGDQADELGVTSDEAMTPRVDTAQDASAPTAQDAAATTTARTARPWWLADDGRDLRTVALPLAEVRGSAELGTMLHAVLEHTDLDALDLDAELARRLDTERRRHGVHADRDTLLLGLQAAVRTPLGPLADDRMLAGTPWRDRLDEPRFELPIAGGDRPTTPAPLGAIADVLAAHLPADDPLIAYPDRLRADGPRGHLRGYLNGAIDLVLRVGQDATGRFLVIDHKTNRLGWPATPTAADYRPQALATAMQAGHYPLQALLYSVALHRLLRGRLRDYDPGRHLGGVLYLFLRGMTGPEVPRVDGAPCGVFAWRPSVALITDLDALLAGRWSPTAAMRGAGSIAS